MMKMDRDKDIDSVTDRDEGRESMLEVEIDRVRDGERKFRV